MDIELRGAMLRFARLALRSGKWILSYVGGGDVEVCEGGIEVGEVIIELREMVVRSRKLALRLGRSLEV